VYVEIDSGGWFQLHFFGLPKSRFREWPGRVHDRAGSPRVFSFCDHAGNPLFDKNVLLLLSEDHRSFIQNDASMPNF
jgi:hypothetical protein